jgi:hypothetical protein
LQEYLKTWEAMKKNKVRPTLYRTAQAAESNLRRAGLSNNYARDSYSDWASWRFDWNYAPPERTCTTWNNADIKTWMIATLLTIIAIHPTAVPGLHYWIN